MQGEGIGERECRVVLVLHQQVPLAVVGFVFLSTIDGNGTAVLVVEREGHVRLHVRAVSRNEPRLETRNPVGYHVVDADVGVARAVVQHVVRIGIHHGACAVAHAIVAVYGHPFLRLAYATREVGVERVFQE